MPTDSHSPELPAAAERLASLPPASYLRALLDSPKPKDDTWQADAGRAVSIVAVGFLNEGDDVAALRSVALLGLAQSLGVKEARKRSLKLIRWAEVAPPPLTTLALKDEQQAALTALAKLTTAWSRTYVDQALGDLSLPEEFVPELLKWARATYVESLSFIQEFYAPQVVSAKTGERTSALLKEVLKLVKPSAPEAVAALAEGNAVLVEALLQSDRAAVSDDKTFSACVAALLHLMQDQAATAPAILFQPTFAIAFGRLSGASLKGAASKQVEVVANALSLATISLLSAELERYGKQAADHWRAMVPTWRAAYSGWDLCFATSVKRFPTLGAITQASNGDAEEDAGAYAAEAVFARLLPAWDAFVAELPDARRVASLSAMLQQAAGTLGIAPLGEVGAVVSYDPLSHHLAHEEDGSPSHVQIHRPGVQVQRADGSTRVLLAALVVAV